MANYCSECGASLRKDPIAAMEREAKKASTPKKKRKASAYSKKYGAAFKRIAPKYKTKSGSWRKGGFKAAQKAAHKEARK